MNVRFIYETPQREIASVLRDLYAQCEAARVVVGFMTVEGIGLLIPALRTNPAKLRSLVVGAATWRALAAFDDLIAVGVDADGLRIHLGHTRETTPGARHSFYRYHPMLHSKVLLFDLPGGRSAAFVGSHNLTGFALGGLNGEAGVLIEGDAQDEVFASIREHLTSAENSAVRYDPAQRLAYAWWNHQFIEGLADKFNDLPREGEAKKTIVILAQGTPPQRPQRNQVIYFELPAGLGQVKSLQAEVHIYLFKELPATPIEALARLGDAWASVWCRTIGVENDRGGAELQASWFLSGDRPRLQSAPKPFRPRPRVDMQQVRVLAYQEVKGHFHYLFEGPKRAYRPILDHAAAIQIPAAYAEEIRSFELIPPEDQPWPRVVGLEPEKPSDEPNRYQKALQKLTPEQGSFILMSMRRSET